MSVLPIFVSHYSLPQQGSILTLEEPGKGKMGGPTSVFDLAKEAGLKDVVLVDDRIDGALQGWKSANKAGVKLCFGIKLTICADGDIKDDASLTTESKVIIFARNGEANAEGLPKGYSDLVRILNRANTRGYYYVSRSSWAWLKEQWTDNLTLALPWASSFIARNTLSFNRIVPDLPCVPWVFRERATDLPFAPLIDTAIDRYTKDNPAQVQDVKTCYYARKSDFLPYMVLRAIGQRESFASPGVDHLSADTFSFDDWKALCPTPTPPPPVSP